jgi:phosphoglucosamine mutase
MTRLFGTDGVRGVANEELTPDLAVALGRAAGMVLAPGGEMIVGRDTRPSGPMLEGALVSGLCSAGTNVRVAGVVPTPAVAFLTVEHGEQAGAVISASHNPVADNGIKFFSAQGVKLSAQQEERIEAAMASEATGLPTGTGVGRAEAFTEGADGYVKHLVSSLEGRLEGLKVVLDCAHGAAFDTAPRAFAEAGAHVSAIHDSPDGSRINVDCGSTSLRDLAAAVKDEGADLGIAFDGDADRALAVDERGEEVDGDRILAVFALRLAERGLLEHDVVVATVMSNLGFVHALESRGIGVVAAPVGDRFVAEAMAESGAVLGGEQSGHIIFGRHATTGDGVLTGMQVALAVADSHTALSKLAGVFEPYPQVLINVEVGAKERLGDAQGLWEEVAATEQRLGDHGRVLIRASGTEPVVRVMVEAADGPAAHEAATTLAGSVSRHLGD